MAVFQHQPQAAPYKCLASRVRIGYKPPAMSARVLISLEDAVVDFGGKPLFNGLNMHITDGDKICLIGKNGAGKTTLMRLITGDLELDGGKRFCLNGITVGYLAQNVPHAATDTVHEFVMAGLPRENRTEDKHHLADQVIAPLELDGGATMGTLSGGQLRRAALARALVAEPDVLLLDEPTNHLDLGAIEWLEKFLNAYRGACVCVSHDRAFLANISRKVFWIDQGTIRVCPTGYAGFEAWADMIIEQEARTLHNMQKKLNNELDWTQGGVTARRKRNQRRMNELNKLRDKLKASKTAHANRLKAVEVDALAPVQASKIIVEFKGVHKSFTRENTTTRILHDFHLRITRGDRIGILGKNGSGKSSFIKLLVGELAPDKGSIRHGKSIDIAYFDQNRSLLNPKKTLWDTLCPEGGDHVFIGNDPNRPRHVCAYLKQFLFDPKAARDLVGTLSGGQQNRLMLAKLLLLPCNVLILDEPTNDLDMDTLDMLTDMLADYKGTLIVVSHDRDFMDRTITEVLAFEGDANVQSFMGGYSDYIEATRGAKKPRVKREAKTASEKPDAPAKNQPKPAPALSGKERHELEKLPEKIAALEKEITTLNATLADAELYTKQPEVFDKTSRRLGKAVEELSTAESRWLELEEKRSAL